MPLTLSLENEQATDQLGAALARVLPPGTVVGLNGPLGAGKTRLVQAIASALGVPPGTVTSPTFVLINEYRQGRLPLFHFDVYRLKDEDEFLQLGSGEYFESNGICLIEWSSRVADLLPEDRIEITLEVESEQARLATITAHSPRLEPFVEQLRQAIV